MSKETGRVRYVVDYAAPPIFSDWCLRNNRREYFETLEEAQEFASKYKHKGKPSYYQPTIHKEVEVEKISLIWRLEK